MHVLISSFFIFVCIVTWNLTKVYRSLSNSNIKNKNFSKAIQILESAVIIAWIIILSILIGILLVFIFGVRGSFNKYTNAMYLNLKYLTGEHKILVITRIIIFSTLIGYSLLIGSLIISVNYYLKRSPGDYKKEIGVLEEIAKLLLIHTFIFILVQFVIFIFGYMFRNK